MNAAPPRHSATVRVTHWITTLCVLALLVSGVEILISHPRFYWGESGNVMLPPAFTIPIPSSRGAVKTGYNFVLPDQNHWSRSLHFQSAWFLFFAALAYGVHGLRSGHFSRQLLPGAGAGTYNPYQRAAYSAVVFLLVPLLFWTGLAMSPGFVAGFPLTVTLLGGTQSARTIHFFVTLILTAFAIGHVFMVYRAGFVELTRAMLTGPRSQHE